MNIAIIRRAYITELDGVTKFVFTLADGLKSIGHDVEVVTWGFRGVNKSEELSPWALEKFNSDARIFSVRDKPGRFDHTPWYRIGLDWLIRGSELVNRLGCDAVIMNGIIPLRFLGKKIAVSHGIDMGSDKVDFIKRLVAKNLYRNCIRVCVSRKLAAEYRRFLGLGCEIIPLPLKICGFNPRKWEEREDSILHVGTRPVKNLETSIETCKELAKRKIRVKLIVVGAKRRHSELLICNGKRCGIDVEARYDLSAKELYDLYSRVKALILPSKYEASSYVSLESMASGTPIVVSQAIPAEIAINCHNGFRIKTYNPTEYARSMALLLKDPILWTRLSENALRFIRDFDHIDISRRYLELLEKAREN